MVCYTNLRFFLQVQLFTRDTSDSPSQILKIVVLTFRVTETKLNANLRVCLIEKIMKLILAGGFLQIIFS